MLRTEPWGAPQQLGKKRKIHYFGFLPGCSFPHFHFFLVFLQYDAQFIQLMLSALPVLLQINTLTQLFRALISDPWHSVKLCSCVLHQWNLTKLDLTFNSSLSRSSSSFSSLSSLSCSSCSAIRRASSATGVNTLINKHQRWVLKMMSVIFRALRVWIIYS